MPIDWADVQGLVVYGNSYPVSWQLFYSLPSESIGKEFLDWIRPQIATAAPFVDDIRPDSLTFLGLTYRGLRVLGLERLLKKINPDFTLGDTVATTNPFPAEFIDGPERNSLGDTSARNAPATWWNGRFTTDRIHGSLHVYCRSEQIAQQRLSDIRNKFQALGIEELNPNGAGSAPLVGHTLADQRRVHFGYVDGIAQPDVDWENDVADAAKVGRQHFLLGYDGPIQSSPSFVRTGDFFRNGSYMAFRWMSQDVPAFEQFLTDNAPLLRQAFPAAIDLRELLAAKLVGRWRSGASLLDAPVNEDATLIPGNSMSYKDSDPDGLMCPFSAHVRSSNPRDQELNSIIKGVPRLMRRGIAYGPQWEKGVNDDADRGLLGMFLCASLERQFQMIIRWMNTNDFSPKVSSLIPLGQDPLFGARGTAAGRPPFRIPVVGGTIEVAMPAKAFVRSRGAAYLLLPGLKTLSKLIAPAN